MASSCYAMQAMSCGNLTSFARVGPKNLVFGPSSYVLPLKRNAKFRVRSMSEDDEKEQQVTETGAPNPLPKPNPTPKPKQAKTTSFTDVFSFSGPAPERINGRLAMIGFAAAIGMELASGQDLFSQVQNGGVEWFLGTSALLTVASLVPIFRGVTVESKSGGVMTSDAELWNGRFAMIGLVALAFTEYLKGTALIV